MEKAYCMKLLPTVTQLIDNTIQYNGICSKKAYYSWAFTHVPSLTPTDNG